MPAPAGTSRRPAPCVPPAAASIGAVPGADDAATAVITRRCDGSGSGADYYEAFRRLVHETARGGRRGR
jgi:hypothetical protein